jgi:hypothetical protein
MITDPYVPTPPTVEHKQQSKLAAMLAALTAALRAPMFDSGKHRRAGVTKNKGRKRNRVRARMARESRRRNRG